MTGPKSPSISGYNSCTGHALAAGVTMRTYLQITGTIFGLVVLGHALRLILHWTVQLAGWAVPMWLSALAILIAGSLCIWAFRLAGRVPR
jgi:hypothetical protein